MKKSLMISGIALGAVALFVAAQVVSQEKGPGQPPMDDDMARMMAKWAEANKPGPQHAELAKAVGKWTSEAKMWMAPGAPPSVSEGTAEFRLILGGRYLEQRYQCTAQQFEGLGIEGYDTFKKQYVSIWVDNMSTGIFMSTGTADESGKVITYHGKMDDPITGQKDKVVKSIMRKTSDDEVVFEMYDTTPDGKEFKSMEMVYKRAK